MQSITEREGKRREEGRVSRQSASVSIGVQFSREPSLKTQIDASPDNRCVDEQLVHMTSFCGNGMTRLLFQPHHQLAGIHAKSDQREAYSAAERRSFKSQT